MAAWSIIILPSEGNSLAIHYPGIEDEVCIEVLATVLGSMLEKTGRGNMLVEGAKAMPAPAKPPAPDVAMREEIRAAQLEAGAPGSM